MEENDLVNFNQAASAAGVHLNTIRNWRKAGRLRTAQKVVEKGTETWYVSLDEVMLLASQSNNKAANNKRADNVKSNVEQDVNPGDTGADALAKIITPHLDIIRQQETEIGELSELRRRDAESMGQLRTEVSLLRRIVNWLLILLVVAVVVIIVLGLAVTVLSVRR